MMPLLTFSFVPEVFAVTNGPEFPLFTAWWSRLIVIAIGYVVTLSLSGVVVQAFVKRAVAEPADASRTDPSVIIGKCENIITITFVLADQITGLALIFAGKSWVRSDTIKQDPGFYLGGTLVNLVWGLLVGFALRLLVFGGL